MNVHIIDIIVLIPILWGAFKGYKNGIISEGGTILALILGIWASVRFSSFGGNYIQKLFGASDQYKEIIAFSLIFIIVVILSFYITKLIHNLFKAIKLEWLNKLLGVAFGATKYLLILSFLFFITETLSQKYYKKPIPVFENSLFFKPLSSFAHSVLEGNICLPDIDFSFENKDFL